MTVTQDRSSDQSVMEQSSFEAQVEATMGTVLGELTDALGVLLFSLGTRSGLWAALAGAGGLTPAEVASRVAVDPALVREWLCAQAAGGYLDYDAASGCFRLPDAVAAAVVHGPAGTLVEACVSMMTSMAEGFDDFSDAFGHGRGFGWHERSAKHWHGSDAFTRMALPQELLAAILGSLPDVVAALDAGGSVVDVGCGFGAPTLGIASLHPAASVFGIDYHDASVMHARDAAAQAVLTNVRFEVAAASDLPGTGYDLVTFFDSLHDLGDPLGALRAARAAVSPTGAVLLVEPVSADDVAGNLTPSGRMFYAISTLACTPNAVSQRTATSSEPLGAQAGERALRGLAIAAGFSETRRVEVPAPMNLVLELRP